MCSSIVLTAASMFSCETASRCCATRAMSCDRGMVNRKTMMAVGAVCASGSCLDSHTRERQRSQSRLPQNRAGSAPNRSSGGRCAGGDITPGEVTKSWFVLAFSGALSPVIGPVEALGRSETLPIGDFVKPSREDNRYVALFGGVPLHLRLLRRIGAAHHARIAGLHGRRRSKCSKYLIFPDGGVVMRSKELQQWLKKRGCAFARHKGGSGHLTVRRGDHTSQLPMHGSRRELGTKLVAEIKRDLGFIS